MKKLLRLRNKRAQGMTEYIIIVGVIAILSIGAFKLFGGEIGNATNQAQNKVKSEVTDVIAGDGQANDQGN